MKNIIGILITAFAICFSACTTCSTCEYEVTVAGVSSPVSVEFCSDDDAEIDAFEAGHELDATTAGTTAICTRN